MKKNIILVLFLSTILTGCGDKKDIAQARQQIDVAALLKQDPSIKPVVVIGGGIAGLTAANYLLQANVPCLVLEGPKPGGALAQSDSVRNWPGVFDAPGIEITDSLKSQAMRNGALVEAKSLVAIDTKQRPFVLTVRSESGQQETIKAFSCIIAMGANPNYLGIPGESGEKGYWGRGVSNCAVCDGALFKNKIVAVVGGGDSAMVEASYLAGLAKQVYVLIRGDVMKASDKRKVDMVKALPNVTFKFNTVISAIRGNGTVVTHIELLDTASKAAQQDLDIDGLFLAIGSKPNSKLFANQITCGAAGYISLIKGQETSMEGIFAAGDICDPLTKQAVTASSMGCLAALQAKEYLDNIGYLGTGAQSGPLKDVLRDDATHLLGMSGKGTYDEQGNRNKIESRLGGREDRGRDAGVVKTAHPEERQSRISKDVLERGYDHAEALVIPIDSLAIAKTLIKECRDRLLVVDIYGTYCIPCKKMAPIFASCAQDYANGGGVSFANLDISSKEIDINAFTKLVVTDEITQVPTFLFIKQGKVVHRISESMPKDAFVKLIERVR